jgi:uncharacterized 2Fe-2S/4Fe-4S cluster protein (DUF4445 family)
MLHFLAGEDPIPMGHAPFEPVFTSHRVLSAGEIGLSGRGLANDRPIHVLPSASAYVGADIIGGAIATGLAYDQGPCLLLDMGTNGEIILKHGGRTLACATAAGPAFEGSGLTCGMLASPGAISRVRFAASTPDFELEVIGAEPSGSGPSASPRRKQPRGICGSAYIDLLAEGRRVGLIDRIGRLRFDDAAAFSPMKDCVRGEAAVRIAIDAQQQPIVLTEGDIAVLLQAKAAIAAGVLTLLERCGIEAEDVRKAFVAGAFGANLDPDHALDIGLLPAGFRGRIQAVGNTSLAAAYMVALDRHVLEYLDRCACEADVVELNLDEGFESRFIDQLVLPEFGAKQVNT